MTSLSVRATVCSCVLLLAAAACSKSAAPSAVGSSPSPAESSTASSSPSTLTIGGQAANFKGSKDLAGKSTFELELDNDNGLYYFEPTVLVGTPGEKITLILKNVGATKHNFTLESEHINQDVNTPGTSARVTITFPQSGTLQFHCEYHANLGMIGELQVSG
jgi:plastocyanin